MVSPSKKKKVERKGRAPDDLSSPRNNLGSRRVKSSKPLSDKKFYLDIRNNTSLRQVEAKLTSLGAKLELFLVKDVDCVVTDRDDYHKSSSRNLGLITPSPFSVSVSPATTATDSPTDGVISKRTRSRAEAMLEKARQLPQRNTTINVLDNAIAWKIPIYSLPKFLVWLDKIIRKGNNSTPGVRELRGNFLKIETGIGRPDFRHFRSWPRVSYADDEPAAFPPPKPLSRHDPQRMTRKVNKTGKEGSTAPGGGNGYCEICRVHYDQLDTHLTSSQHSKLVTDSSQYSQLDSLISNHDLGSVTSIRKSLRIAKSPPVELGGKQSVDNPLPPTSSPMNGHFTRSRSERILCNGLSPIEKKKKEARASGGSSEAAKQELVKEAERERERDKEIELEREKEKDREKQEKEREKREKEKEKREKERKEKEREKLDKEKERREREKERNKERLSDEQASTEHNLRSRNSSKQSTPQARKIRPSRKRLSVEEKLIEDNKSYYKVEVLNSKLRSTEYFIAQKQAEARVNGDGEVNGCGGKAGEKDVKEPVVVRFRKVRKSQLALLSDEAENFMFGDLTRKETETKTAGSDLSDDSGGRADSDSSTDYETPRKRRKIMSHSSEKHAHSSSSPKNRHHNSYLTSRSNFEEEEEEEKSDDEPLTSLSEITFSFEKPPKSQPWMEDYFAGEKKYYVPYYHQYPTTILPYEYPPAERMKLLSRRSGAAMIRRRGERFSRLLEDGKPRKSPRCHASTLAIMSSIMRRRPVRECTSNPDFTYEEESRSSLPETVESSSSASLDATRIAAFTGDPLSLLPVDPSGDVYAIALARYVCGETSQFQVAAGPCLPVDHSILSDPPPGLESLSKPGLDIPFTTLLNQALSSPPQHRLLDFDNRFHFDFDSGSDCSELLGFGDDGRGVLGRRKKRKRNMTGWPAGKPRKKTTRIKEESDLRSVEQPFKCDPCVIKVEPMCPDMIDQFSFKDEPVYDDGSVNLPVIPIKRGRGRPRKYPYLLQSSSFSTPPMTPNKSSPRKRTGSRLSFSLRRSCLKE